MQGRRKLKFNGGAEIVSFMALRKRYTMTFTWSNENNNYLIINFLKQENWA